MNKFVLKPDQFVNCPICGQECKVDEVAAWQYFNKQGLCQQFLCINPLVENPLHYYIHIVDNSEPNLIAYQEFTLDIGDDQVKYLMVSLNLINQKLIIKNNKNSNPLELDFIIPPDYPEFKILKKKIKTAIVFA